MLVAEVLLGQAPYSVFIQEFIRQNIELRQRGHKLINALEVLSPEIADLFDDEDSVMVMDETPAIKTNRLNLLRIVQNHTRVLADCGILVK